MDIKKLLSQMTIEEKIGQLAQYNANLFANSDAEVTGPAAELGLSKEDLRVVGSTLNFSSVQEMLDIQDKHLAEDPNKIPMLFMMDVIHGFRTIYPIPLALGCSFDPELVGACSRMASKEATASGVQVTFTPMVDYVRDARWGRVMESCGEEPLLNGIMGAAQIRAFHGDSLKDAQSMATCVKHFAAYGGAEAGRDYNTVELSEHTLREYYLPAYKACLDAGVDILMPSFNVLNGVPATANKWLLKKILKEEWQSDVLVISDYAAIGELVCHGIAADMKQAAEKAFDCGVHMEMCSSGYQNHLKAMIEEGVFTEAQLDEAVLKVLQLKEKLGLFEDPYHGASPEKAEAACLTKENRALVKKAAQECAVLLKNDGILPLSKKIKSIAVIGPFAHNHAIKGFWACNGRDEETVTVYEGIRELLPNAEIATAVGCSNQWNELSKDGFAEAVELAKQADAVILCLGEPQDYSGEGNSRADIDLPGVQNELAAEIIKANPNTAAVIFTGRPLALTKLDRTVPAILNMWFPGTEGGSAVASLLFGDANPCGKLSMTFPKAVGQCPIYYNHLETGRPKNPEVDHIHHAYTSNYIDCGNLPLYSFGHGLSYSNFIYEDMTLSAHTLTAGEKVTVKVTVYNDSAVAGKETVMLYLRDCVASTARPVCQLIAFQKIAFAPYERKTVEFTIDEPMLCFWNSKNEFVSEPGKFHIFTGYADHLTQKCELLLLGYKGEIYENIRTD